MKIWIDTNPMKPMFHDAPRAYLALPVGDVYSDIIAVELEGAEGKVLVDREELWLALRRQVAGARAIGEVVDRCSWPSCEFGIAITNWGAERGITYHPAHSGTCPLREEAS